MNCGLTGCELMSCELKLGSKVLCFWVGHGFSRVVKCIAGYGL
jgi:hypothetical protein